MVTLIIVFLSINSTELAKDETGGFPDTFSCIQKVDEYKKIFIPGMKLKINGTLVDRVEYNCVGGK